MGSKGIVANKYGPIKLLLFKTIFKQMRGQGAGTKEIICMQNEQTALCTCKGILAGNGHHFTKLKARADQQGRSFITN